MRYLIAALLVLDMAGISYASSDIAGRIGKGTGFTGRGLVSGGLGAGTPPPTGKILLVDGTSFILQTNASSKICRAGGC